MESPSQELNWVACGQRTKQEMGAECEGTVVPSHLALRRVKLVDHPLDAKEEVDCSRGGEKGWGEDYGWGIGSQRGALIGREAAYGRCVCPRCSRNLW